MLHTFSLSPETLRKYLLRTIWRFQLVVTLSFLLFGLYLAWLAGPLHMQAAVAITIIIALAYFFIIFFNYRQQIRLLYSVRVELDGSGIIYRQHNQEPLRISRADIIDVAEHPDGLLIQTTDSRIFMLIPFGLARDGDEVVRRMLQKWGQAVPPSQPKRRSGRWQRFLGYFFALLIILFANNLMILIPFGVLLFVFVVHSERRLRQDYTALPGSNRMSGMAFSFLFFVLAMKSCIMFSSLLITR
jgi:hypothetical protein